MDPELFKKKLRALGDIRRNADARPGDKRVSDLNDTHGIVVAEIKHAPHRCEDCDQWWTGVPKRDLSYKMGFWVERCECGFKKTVYQPGTGPDQQEH